MKQYPTIPKDPYGDSTHFWVFDKLDGSNIRVEWSKKRGFFKFGSRKRLLGSDQGILAKAELMAKVQEPKFNDTFKMNRIDNAVCFFEFHGAKSFAGNHIANDEHRLTLIDVAIHKEGFIHPGKFIDLFYNSNFDVPNFIHYGMIDEDFKKSVRNGTLEGMTFEGVVCKARPSKKWSLPVMFKIKNEAWIKKVKENFDKSRWTELL